jgi:hypothetical protein
VIAAAHLACASVSSLTVLADLSAQGADARRDNRVAMSTASIPSIRPRTSPFGRFGPPEHICDTRSGIGTLISVMLPYAIVLTIAWALFFVAWYLIGIPLGPGWPIHL